MNLAAARSALVTLVGAVDAPVDPPATYVFSSGSEMVRKGGRNFEWSFRVTCAVGYGGDDATASQDLAALVASKLAVLVVPSQWTTTSVSADQIRQIAGGDQLTADITVTTVVEL